MTDRPIIFSGPMIRALLDGRKSMTRRLLKPQPPEWVSGLIQPYRYPRTEVDRYGEEYPGKEIFGTSTHEGDWGVEIRFEPGDRLWVREAVDKVSVPGDVHYRADYDAEYPEGSDGLGWRPSIHMPRWASRITLVVTDVRVQRLQEISEADAIAEGLNVHPNASYDLVNGGYLPGYSVEIPGGKTLRNAGGSAVSIFRGLWNSIHGPDAWDENPWVAAITFTVHRCNIDALDTAT